MSVRSTVMMLLVLGSATSLGVSPVAGASIRCHALTALDQRRIRNVKEHYRSAWLRGDRAGVMATFSEQPTLMPPSSAAPLRGRQAVEQFWWPAAAPKITVTKLDISIHDIRGNSCVAYISGRDHVEWTSADAAASSRSNTGAYLDTLESDGDGRWRVTVHMWNDDPRLRR